MTAVTRIKLTSYFLLSLYGRSESWTPSRVVVGRGVSQVTPQRGCLDRHGELLPCHPRADPPQNHDAGG
jgi:hypothetical protein